ncbi:MAG: NAD(P)/FAD-dependent oxidoreductase [Gammaproteobacteria bacterium]|nr:NAD(P)/FAD-dependent oxidoreductase [Gammaproteobacteria bacterium]
MRQPANVWIRCRHCGTRPACRSIAITRRAGIIAPPAVQRPAQGSWAAGRAPALVSPWVTVAAKVSAQIHVPISRINVTGEHFDVLVVGAGLSGIGAGYHLQTRCSGKRYLILEARDCIGGTWDLFRYPGARSDSDMYTLGYAFRPWPDARTIADAPSILSYVRDTARAYGIDRRIRFNHRVVRAAWSSAAACWKVEAERGPRRETVRLSCNFLYLCSGYYDYAQGHLPAFPGRQRFRGRIVHPQQWPDDLDYAGKRVLVIGSGATAMTLVPALAATAAQVTLLQRSPGYVVALPAEDRFAGVLRRALPQKLAYGIARWKNVLLNLLFFKVCRRWPGFAKKLIRKGVAAGLPPGYDVETHFKPRYNPWDQRLCVVPDGDLFTAIRDGRATVVTDRIETFTAQGVRLASGVELQADIIVTATGLKLLALGGIRFSVDGAAVELARALSYKGMMLSDIPNLAMALGYTNASWTLKAELSSRYLCRLLNYMDQHGFGQCTPRNSDPAVRPQPLLDLSSGYVLRAVDRLPKQGSKPPWRLYQNYLRDMLALRYGAVDDGVMRFSSPARTAQAGRKTAL